MLKTNAHETRTSTHPTLLQNIWNTTSQQVENMRLHTLNQLKTSYDDMFAINTPPHPLVAQLAKGLPARIVLQFYAYMFGIVLVASFLTLYCVLLTGVLAWGFMAACWVVLRFALVIVKVFATLCKQLLVFAISADGMPITICLFCHCWATK